MRKLAAFALCLRNRKTMLPGVLEQGFMLSPFSKTDFAEWLAANVAADNSDLSQVAAWRGIGCLLRWLEIVSREKSASFIKSVFGDLERLVIHVDHSSLLRRLLHGKEPLCLLINQSAEWRILTRVGPEEWVVTCGDGRENFRVWRDPALDGFAQWRLKRVEAA
jgi:hypothetical protein